MFIIQINHESDNRSTDPLMTSLPSKNITVPASVYQTLLKQVKKTLIEGQARIEAERVRTYWETGRIIHTHILKNKDRADYGAQVIKRLAGDLGLNERLLERCVKFAKAYSRPPISTGRSKFTWTHYRELMSVPDSGERDRLEARASRHQWSADELVSQIRASKGERQTIEVKKETAVPQTPLTPARGTRYTYRFVSRPVLGDNPEGRALLLDLGFGVFKDIDPRVAARFQDQQVVESRLKDGQYTFTGGERTPKDLFTYAAYIEKVIDGDTLKVRIDQGFDIWNRQVLRLRDIDCPEVGTKDGDAAKNFVRSLLKEASLIVLRSSKSDKYDRYLADVFIPQGKEQDSATDVYLNNLLLEKGYAERV